MFISLFGGSFRSSLFQSMPIQAILASSELTVCLTLISFSLLLMTVLQQHTSAGLSRNFVAFSCAGSLFLCLTSRRWSLTLVYLLRFVITTALFLTVRFKYRLKSSAFRDRRRTIIAVPAAFFLSIPAAIDAGFLGCLNGLGRWLCVFGILCQVYLTKQCKRITIFKGQLPVHITTILLDGMAALIAAFRTEGSEMWTLWLTGMTTIGLAIDFVYYVVQAKYKGHEFELPRAFGDSNEQ
jgi:hypothetical protein